MPGICRVGVDLHVGHASPTPNPFHQFPYTSTPQSSVTVEGALAVVVGGTTACGDPAVGGSSLVTIEGIPVHRRLDATGGHGSWVPNAAKTGSTKVIAGG
jgi:uncharacterized Zn-binding protein involved in type VI secretion